MNIVFVESLWNRVRAMLGLPANASEVVAALSVVCRENAALSREEIKRKLLKCLADNRFVGQGIGAKVVTRMQLAPLSVRAYSDSRLSEIETDAERLLYKLESNQARPSTSPHTTSADSYSSGVSVRLSRTMFGSWRAETTVVPISVYQAPKKLA